MIEFNFFLQIDAKLDIHIEVRPTIPKRKHEKKDINLKDTKIWIFLSYCILRIRN